MSASGWLPNVSNPLTPGLTVGDAEGAFGICERAFGFRRGEFAMRDDDGGIVQGKVHYHGRSIAMLAPECAFGGTDRTPAHAGIRLPLSFYGHCPGVDRAAVDARAAGATSERGPEDMFWGDRTAMIRDPDGCLWMSATKKGELDPSNAPRLPGASRERELL